MQTMTSQQKLEYAKILQKMHNIYIIKENLYFTHQNKNYNKAAKQIETVIEKQLKNNITAAIDGTIDLQKNIDTEHIITTALKSQHKMLTRQDDRYLRTATKNNIKTYNKILQNRIEKESVSLQSKIEAEANRQKYRKLSSDEAKRILNSKFEGMGTRRAKNIVRDALHTNESNLSWIANLNNDYKYKIWMNGRGKGKVRPWHRAKQIQPCYIDDYFDIYGSYHAQMMYPGDLNGGAENVANCRCWIQYTNITPSNLKTKGTIQVNPNVKLKNTDKERPTQNNYSLISNIKNKTTTAISNIKNKVKNIRNNFSVGSNENYYKKIKKPARLNPVKPTYEKQNIKTKIVNKIDAITADKYENKNVTEYKNIKIVKDKGANYLTEMDIKEIYDMLPSNLTKYVKQININKKIIYIMEGYVGGEVFPNDTKIINIYNTPFNKQDYIPILIHELGHVLDLNYNKKFYHFTNYVGISNSPEWENAMIEDGNFKLQFVTDYAFERYKAYLNNKKNKMLYMEDFADSICLYLWDDRDNFIKNYPNRSKIIEKLLYG